MTIAEYQKDLAGYADFFKTYKIHYVTHRIYRIFEDLCSIFQRQCIPEKALLCLVIGKHIIFNCDDGVDFIAQTDADISEAIKKMEAEEK